MESNKLLLALAASALVLASCAGNASSSSATPPPGPSTSSTGSDPEPATAIDDAFIAALSANSIVGEGTLANYGSETNVELFIGTESYEFFDYDDFGYYYQAQVLHKNADGTVQSYYRDITNEIFDSQLLLEGSKTAVLWDNNFYNPFGKIAASDLTEDGAGGYDLAADKVNAFCIPLMFYSVGTYDSVSLSRLGDSLAISIAATDARGDDMDMSIEVRQGEEADRAVPVPYETEECHEGIDAALYDWTMALAGPSDTTGFVYEKTMTPLDDDSMSVASSKSTVTYNAVLFANDGGITSENDWGYALYSDGKYYEFEVVDGTAVRGEPYEGSSYYPIPSPNIIAAEMFVPTKDQDTYLYRDPATATEALIFLLEDANVIGLVSYLGAKDLTIHIGPDGYVDNFSYTSGMYNYGGGLYHERVSVDIAEFDTATIDYDFTIEEIAPIPDMYGTWTGTDYWEGTEYTLEISEDSVILNGNAAELVLTETNQWGYYIGTLTSGQDTFAFEYYPASSGYPKQILLENDTCSVYLEIADNEPIAMPDELIGSWHGEEEGSGFAFDVVILSGSDISINGVSAEVGEWGETSDGLGYKAELTVEGTVYVLTYRPAAGTFRLTDETGALVVDLVRTGEAEPAIDPKFVGTWQGIDDAGGASHTLVINADATATYDGVAFDEPLEFVKTVFSEKATATLGDKEYEIEYLSGLEGDYIKVTDEDYVEATLYKSFPSFDFPDEYVGTWSDGTHELVMGGDGTIVFDGTPATSFVSTGFEGEYVAVIGGETYDISYVDYSGQQPFFSVLTPDGNPLILRKA